MKKVKYVVTYLYCSGYLANSATFTDKNEAVEFATEIAKDIDNSDITITEITNKSFFKK